jgi:hypothetical protein
MRYPRLQPLQQVSEVQDTFMGLNKNSRTNPREWSDMTNVSPRDFPMFAPREPRGTVAALAAPAGIMERDALVYVDGASLYVNSAAVTGLTLTVDYEDGAGNLIVNSDWAGGVYVAWTGTSGLGLSSEQKYGTKNTLKLSKSTAGFQYVGQTVSGVDDGEDYTLSFYVYLNAAALANNARIAQITFYRADGAMWSSELITASDAGAAGEWVRVTKTYTAPLTASYAIIRAHLNNSAGTEAYTAYYTNFQFEAGSAATAWTNNDPRVKQKDLVSMGAYIIVMPDRMYVNTSDLTDYGSIDSAYSFSGDVTLTPARVDGTELDMDTVSVGVTAPVDPDNGDYWVDTTGDTHVLKQYSSTSDVWTEIPSAYTKVALIGIGAYFSQYDGVAIDGLDYAGSDPALSVEVAALNGTKVLYVVETDYVIVSGILSQVHTVSGASVTVTREMPDVDFLTESENRLWGCKYGLVDGETVNELYACALGDFKNWNQFQGISTDSYAVSLGTDGEFTGAATHLGYPVFFKETCLHKVYGNMPSNYRVETTECRGVQEGSHRSLVAVNEVLFYKGRTDILAYDGSLPVGAGDALGGETYRDARAGAFKERYYVSMKDSLDDWHLFVFDTKKRLWFREDATEAYGFAQADDELYYLDAGTNNLMAVFGKAGTKETSVSFSATTGIIGFENKDHKYVSRLLIRAKIDTGATLSVYLDYDSSDAWELAGSCTAANKVRTTLMPVIPRRCDHFRMKLTGTNEVRIFSIAKVMESGGDGAWT